MKVTQLVEHDLICNHVGQEFKSSHNQNNFFIREIIRYLIYDSWNGVMNGQCMILR